ncbi:MAG: lytic transglycosylase domain-containing protein, partial [Acidimicrobiales bacterium]
PAPPSLPAALLLRPERLRLIPSFDHWAATYGVPADLLKALAWLESGWQSRKVSPAGALGIGQLMPATVQFVNHKLLRANLDPADPDDNIRMSARFLRYLLDRSGDDPARALAAYYQGLGSVERRGPLPQARRYVANVEALRPRFG